MLSMQDCVCVYSNSRNDLPPSGSAVRNHCCTHPAPCVRPRCVCRVLHAHVQFSRFDKADATADVQWHCNHRPPLWYHYFPAQSSLGADILVYWIGKVVRTCAPGGSRTLDFLHARRAPYPLGQALRFPLMQDCCCSLLLYTTVTPPHNTMLILNFCQSVRWSFCVACLLLCFPQVRNFSLSSMLQTPRTKMKSPIFWNEWVYLNKLAPIYHRETTFGNRKWDWLYWYKILNECGLFLKERI